MAYGTVQQIYLDLVSLCSPIPKMLRVKNKPLLGADTGKRKITELQNRFVGRDLQDQVQVLTQHCQVSPKPYS